ncbi:hypothetical protein ACHAWF_004398 [Thalassiosira exigua]
MKLRFPNLLVSLWLATTLTTAEGNGIGSLRSTLLRANPALSVHQRTMLEREASVNPLQPTLRAFQFWRRVYPIVWDYRLTGYWNRIARRNDPEGRAKAYDALHTKHAPDALKVILELRGIYVKIGQVLSSRADFIPRQYVDAFSALQDQVNPYEQDRIEWIIRESLQSCQELDMEDVFESVDEVLGSASIGQVHKAKLTPKYGGGTVAVKVMHPNAETQFANDFKVFIGLTNVALSGWGPIVRELETQMMTEFDYTNEANDLRHVRANVLHSPYADKVIVPEPMVELCSKHVLVMEYLSGKKLAEDIELKLARIVGDIDSARKVLKAKQQAMFESKDVGRKKKKSLFREFSEIVGESEDGLPLIHKTAKAVQLMSMMRDVGKKLSLLLDATGHQIFIDGVYNGDPHPGNVLVLDCGRLGLIDYGQTRRLTKPDRLALARVVAAVGKHHPDVHEVSNAMRTFGFRTRDGNDDIMAKFAALYFDSDAEGKKMGCSSPQIYLLRLESIDPMIEVPDPAVFVARTSFLFRGLGSILQQQLHTSAAWRDHALLALATDGEGRQLYNLGLTPIRAESST